MSVNDSIILCNINIILCPPCFFLHLQRPQRQALQTNVKFTWHHDISSADINVCFFFIAVDFVSAPFCVSKSHIYEGIENPDTFFRPALRSLLVSNVLMLLYNMASKLKMLDHAVSSQSSTVTVL